MVKIVLIEKNIILSHHLKEAFDQDQKLHLVSICTEGNELMKLLITQPVDVVLIDYLQTNGFVVTHELNKNYPHIKVIGFSEYESDAYNNRIIELGASKNLSKYQTSLAQLVKIIKSV